MARKETNYAIKENKDRVYGIGASAFQYNGRQRTSYQQGRSDSRTNGNYNGGANYEQKAVSERYPIGNYFSAQESYSGNSKSGIKPHEDAFSLTFCSRCGAIRQKNSLCIRCGGL